MNKRYVCLSAVVALVSTAARAEENGQPIGSNIVGLDGFSYLDLPPNGVYLQDYTGYVNARRIVDKDGNEPLPNADVEAKYNLLRLSAMPDLKLLGANWGAFEVFVTYTETKFTYAGRTIRANGIGDIAVDPFGLAWKRGNDNFGFSTTVSLPLGSYKPNRAVNIGSNRVTWLPQLFHTRFFDNRKADISTHIVYEVPFKNSQGKISAVNPTGADYRSGQVLHVGVAFRRSITDTWAIGLNAIGAIQVSDDRITGDERADAILRGPLDGNRFRKVAFGGSVRYIAGRKVPLSLTYFRDAYARNGTMQDTLIFRVTAPLAFFGALPNTER